MAAASTAIRVRTRLSIGVLIETIVRLLLRAHGESRRVAIGGGGGQGIRQRGPLFVLAITGDTGSQADRQIDRRNRQRERVRGWVLLVFILFVFFFCSNIDLLFVIF